MSKKKVIHTRVSEELYDRISKKAEDHRVTVSNLVRNLVEDVIEIHGDLSDVFDKKLKKSLFSKDDDSVLGHQAITLGKNTNCNTCEKSIKKGSRAFIEIYEHSNDKSVVCETCKQKKVK